jgi:hypothetical protein
LILLVLCTCCLATIAFGQARGEADPLSWANIIIMLVLGLGGWAGTWILIVNTLRVEFRLFRREVRRDLRRLERRVDRVELGRAVTGAPPRFWEGKDDADDDGDDDDDQ